MSSLALIRDEAFQHHITPAFHPESKARLSAIDNALAQSALNLQLTQLPPRAASEDELCLAHNPAYVEELKQRGAKAKKEARVLQLDPDTFISAESYEIAKLAVGAGFVGIDALAGDKHASIFAAVRPPGHHALTDRPMGFCLLNNIALAARYAQKKMSLKRVLIIDWDVHHGNGTEAMFYDDPTVCFVSFHQYPFWPPNSGWYTEDGTNEGRGYNINIPLPAGTGDEGYLQAWNQVLQPICLEYQPELILVSAGYDAHEDDPLGQQRISTPGFAHLSERLFDLSNATTGKVICFLEGGYNTRALSDSVIATIQALNSQVGSVARPKDSTIDSTWKLTRDEDHNLVSQRIADVRKHFFKYWPCLK